MLLAALASVSHLVRTRFVDALSLPFDMAGELWQLLKV